MAIQERDLPQSLVESEFSEPARLLQEQARELSQEYAGILYGRVQKSLLPPPDGVAYEFLVGIEGKPFKLLLVSLRHGKQAEYPVRIHNTLEDRTRTANNADALKQHLCSILNDSATLDQFERMKEYAKKS